MTFSCMSNTVIQQMLVVSYNNVTMSTQSPEEGNTSGLTFQPDQHIESKK